MTGHRYITDPLLALSRGPRLANEGGIGALTLGGFLEEVAARFAGREALVFPREDGGTLRWSYADLRSEACAVAKALIADGLARGERVGVLMTNRPEFLASVFGVALAGGVAAPISTFSTAAELAHLLEVSGVSLLLFDATVLRKDFAAILAEIEPEVAQASPGGFASLRFPFLRRLVSVGGESRGAILDWNAWLARGAPIAQARITARAAAVKPADPGGLFFSSGSTARPKAILSSHRGIALQMWRMGPQQGLCNGVRSWTANGFFWSGNFAMIVGGTLALGGAIVLQRVFEPEAALAMMADERVSFLFAWPHQWEQLIAAPNWENVDLSSLTYIDAQSPVARHPTVHSHWVEPRHCYGNTETFTLSTAYPAMTSREEAAQSHGLPLAGNTLKIVDPLSGRILPIGERGELAVKGPTLMLGYLGVPLDESLDDEGFLRTSDGGYVDEAGRLVWEGRLNDIIKTGGANVSPLEIDAVLRECPGVKIVQTVGVPDELLGEMVVSCIVAHDGAVIDEEAVRAFAKTRLASYKLPRRVLLFAEHELATTGSAKVKTAELRKLAADRLRAA